MVLDLGSSSWRKHVVWVYIPPKSVQVNFLWGKMTSERLLNSFIPPKKFYTPPPQKKQISGYAPEHFVQTKDPAAADPFAKGGGAWRARSGPYRPTRGRVRGEPQPIISLL